MNSGKCRAAAWRKMREVVNSEVIDSGLQTYRMNARNGYYGLDRTDSFGHNKVGDGSPMIVRTNKQAQEIENACNDAYDEGFFDALVVLQAVGAICEGIQAAVGLKTS
jgi:hypothetical protein